MSLSSVMCSLIVYCTLNSRIDIGLLYLNHSPLVEDVGKVYTSEGGSDSNEMCQLI